MERLHVIDSVMSPDGRELVLYRRGDAFYIQIGDENLMASRIHGSEEGLARLGLRPLAGHPAPRVLVGGLGMGFTLRATLDALGGRTAAEVVVAEFFAAVVGFNRGPLAHLAGHPLDDPRVRVEQGDVADVIDSGAPFDAILLDVDNGPEAVTLDANRRLYSLRGLERARGALAPGGVLAVWSAAPAPFFEDRLRRTGFEVSSHRVPARNSGKGGTHVVFVARRG